VVAQAETIDALLLDMLEWIGPSSRPYDEALEAWRTSCPRLPVWEEAVDRGFVVRTRGSRGACVSLSSAGAAHLRSLR
jgi:hypothetical protein